MCIPPIPSPFFPLLGRRLGSTSGLALSSTGATVRKLVLPGAGEDPSSREGKALAFWMLDLFGPRRSFPWTARRIMPLMEGGGRHQSWGCHPWKGKIIFVGAAEALLGCVGFLHNGAASCEQVWHSSQWWMCPVARQGLITLEKWIGQRRIFTDSRMPWVVVPVPRKSLSQLLFSTNTEAIQDLNLALEHYPTGIVPQLLWGGSKIHHKPSGGQLWWDLIKPT